MGIIAPAIKNNMPPKVIPPSSSGFGRDLFIFLSVLFLLWFVWLYTGGPERAYRQGPFIKPPIPAGGTGETYGNLGDIKILETLKAKSGIKSSRGVGISTGSTR